MSEELTKAVQSANDAATIMSGKAHILELALERMLQEVSKLRDSIAHIPRVIEQSMGDSTSVTVSANDAYGLMAPLHAWSCAEISDGRLREVLGEWINGKRSWSMEEFGLTEWPTQKTCVDMCNEKTCEEVTRLRKDCDNLTRALAARDKELRDAIGMLKDMFNAKMNELEKSMSEDDMPF